MGTREYPISVPPLGLYSVMVSSGRLRIVQGPISSAALGVAPPHGAISSAAVLLGAAPPVGAISSAVVLLGAAPVGAPPPAVLLCVEIPFCA